MGIWIRSQNKENLVNASRISVSDKRIINEVLNDNYDILGKYETDLRAIQVLNLIKNNIADFKYADMCQDKENAPKYIVFEMPIK